MIDFFLFQKRLSCKKKKGPTLRYTILISGRQDAPCVSFLRDCNKYASRCKDIRRYKNKIKKTLMFTGAPNHKNIINQSARVRVLYVMTMLFRLYKCMTMIYPAKKTLKIFLMIFLFVIEDTHWKMKTLGWRPKRVKASHVTSHPTIFSQPYADWKQWIHKVNIF